ncbi:MAG TPA: tetratricopeptide repeat protein, partial [Anaeromyxobacteraceae bacterium]|nr:tetratricopeptide repeat protein [Anaeromyxobacteraceae bacterium]
GLFLLVALALPAAAGLEARPGLTAPERRRAALQAAGVAAALSLTVLPYLAGKGTDLAAARVARWFGDAPASSVALTMSRVMGEYWRILAFPAFLGGDFAYAARLPTIDRPTAGFAVATLAWLAILALALWLLWRRRAPVVAVGLLWTFAGLLPVMQIIPVGVLLAERLLYLPSVGFCLAAAGAFERLTAPAAAPGKGGAVRPRWRPSPRAAHAALGVVLALLAARTVARTLDWRTALAVWESEAEKAPREVVVNNNLAVEYTRRGDYRRAVERLRVALQVSPRYWRAHVNLGIALQGLGDRAGARRAYREAMRLAPDALDPPFWLARLCAEEGDLEQAASLAARARALAPEQARLAVAHARYLIRLGRVEEARAALRDALRLDPSDAEAKALLADLGG